jgi:ABC-type lipoprotein release transport system permease subunit
MTQTISAPPRRGQPKLPPTVTLAGWRLQQTWRLLLVTGLGMLAAVVLLCAVPLYSQVAMTAGLRGVLNATPQDSEITISSHAKRLASSFSSQVDSALRSFMQGHLGNYLEATPQFSIQTTPLTATAPTTARGDQLQLVGASIQAPAPHLTLLSGRLPAPAQDGALEMALTQETAAGFGLSSGESLTLRVAFLSLNLPVDLHLVGIFKPTPGDPYWHGNTFAPYDLGSFYIGSQALVDNTALLSLFESGQGGGLAFLEPPALFWYYHFRVPQLHVDQLDDMIAQLQTAQVQILQRFGDTTFLTGTQLLSPTLEGRETSSSLQRYHDRISLVQVPVSLLLLQVFCLVLLFISMMAEILVDRQAGAIALLRSRGASRWQVFGSFVTQGAVLGVLALVTGPLLAIIATRLLVQHTLAPSDQGALNILDGNALKVALSAGWFALVAVLGALFTMAMAIRNSASRDVLEMRHEASRTTRRPLWERLQLDVAAALVALGGYGVSLYIAQAHIFEAQVNLLIAAPLALIAPIFLVIAGVLFFLRFFPRLLNRVSRAAARRPGAGPVLALTQLVRAPRQATRLILLLALASGFAIFTLIFSASQAQQVVRVAAQQVGADFSGSVPSGALSYASLADVTTAYRSLPGVLSATLGYANDVLAVSSGQQTPIQMRAVDTSTFGKTALWNSDDSAQSLPALLQTLTNTHTPFAGAGIPAIVDTLAWNALHLSVGEMFRVNVSSGQLPIIAVAEIQHLPTVNDSLVSGGTSDYSPPGGMLVDFQQLSSFYTTFTTNFLPINHIWLRSSDNPQLLASLRSALNDGTLHLQDYLDRRALMTDLQSDPLTLDLLGALTIGASLTVVLALVGNLIASWLNARTRLTSFAVLRALGTEPRQIASVLTWEQAIIYATALALGLIFGLILAFTIVPALAFTGAPQHGQTLSSGEFYAIQHVLPVQLVFPPSLAVVFGLLIALCAAALWLMARVVSRPALSQTLRLSED